MSGGQMVRVGTLGRWGGALRRAALASVLLGLLGAASAGANSVLLCGWAGCDLFILGPHTPNPRSSPHMGFHIRPYKVKAGSTFTATARGFVPGEYVTIWDYTGRHFRGHSTELNGGNASGRGALKFTRETIAGGITKVGLHKICLQGERSHRVACATYRVLSAGPATGPGYVPPGSSGSGTGSGSGTSGWTPPTTGPGYVPPGSG